MAQTLSVEEVLAHVRKAAMFIEGITVSGGEATTQLPFLVALFSAIKSTPSLQHLSCLVDSNGLLAKRAGTDFCPCVTGR
jgi:pyruvate-formate lyase-activating enzyme